MRSVPLHFGKLVVGTAFVFIAIALLIAAPTPAFAQSVCPAGTDMSLGTCRCDQVLIGRGDSQRSVLQCRATTSTGATTGQPTTTITSVLGAGGVTRQTVQTDNGDGTVTQKSEVGEAAKGGSVLDCISNPGMCFVEALKYSMSALVGGLAYVVLAIASFVLWIVGGLFNWVVIKTVFQFGSTFGTSEGMLIAWGILRDIGNIVLLFSFIFMGLATILNTHALDEYSARKALPRLIIFAVLLNFSLFAAQIVIDVSNSMAAVFTAQAGLSGCTEGAGGIDSSGEIAQDACANNGIAGQVIQMAGVSGVWNATDIGSFMSQPSTHAPVFIGLAIFVTVTAVVLLAAAIMLVFRAVMLCLLMVLSPIGFAGMAIPPLQEFARDWWRQLIKNAFFAPIYLLLVLISLKIVEGLIGPNDNGSFAKAMIEGGTNAPQIFVIFAVVIAFMVASLMVANKLGVAGAKFATERAGKIVGGATLGSVGFIGRRTLGSASLAAGTAIRRNRYLTEVNPGLGRLLAKGADKGANASYSVRGLASKAASGSGLDFGKASKDVSHGIHGIEEKAVKERLDYAKSFKGRSENDKDVEERTSKAERNRTVAESAIDTRSEEEAEAKLEKKRIETEADDLSVKVNQLRLDVQKARDEGTVNPVLEKKLREEERNLRAKENELGEADKSLADASKKLAEARKAEADFAKEAADTTYRDISAKDQQQRYADNIEHKGIRIGSYTPTLGPHANHEAAIKIRKNANKSDIEKALDTIKESTEKKDKDDDHGGGGDHKPAPAGGGGGGHAH